MNKAARKRPYNAKTYTSNVQTLHLYCPVHAQVPTGRFAPHTCADWASKTSWST